MKNRAKVLCVQRVGTNPVGGGGCLVGVCTVVVGFLLQTVSQLVFL